MYTLQVKYTDENYYLISIDEGILFKRASGELLKNGNKVVLRCIIGDEITTVNIYRSKNSVIIFDQVGLFSIMFFAFKECVISGLMCISCVYIVVRVNLRFGCFELLATQFPEEHQML